MPCIQVRVAPARFEEFEKKYLEWFTWVRQQLRLAQRRYLEVEYDELGGKEQLSNTWARVQHFIDMPPVPLGTIRIGRPLFRGHQLASFTKQSTSSVSSRISNFGELLRIDRAKYYRYTHM